MPVSLKRSSISLRRHSLRFKRYSLSPERYTRRVTVTSLKSTGSMPSLLSNVKETSQYDCGFLSSLPLNMTSSILVPRSVRALCSPSTQRTASAMLLLPLPLGPMMLVIPGSKISSVFRANDLNPFNSSFTSCTCNTPIC
ncbi:hypothetical protein SDC9_172213 [bioreactor metagenome]|uniref:Uncharacterized protein n=1 Tax=bioreactor metagenome TaxID=1076179 RepID=A0A645GD24_9ZZZZ